MKDLNIVESNLLEEKKDKLISVIKTARVQKGLTQEQFGDIVGLSRNTVARIENRKFLPSMETFLLILDALNATLKINNEEI